ncbi:hypothetical protein [Arthrobacter sp. R4-81]
MRDRNYCADGTKRLSRRRKLLLWSAVPVLLVMLVTAKIFSLGALGNAAADGFDRGDSAAVASAASGLAIANIFEPHKALFAAGDALVLEQDYAGARGKFSEALAAAPASDACRIRVNLVLAIEALGDTALEAGDSIEAARLYAEGLAVIKEAPPECFPESSSAQGSEGEKLNRAGARLKEKSGQGSQQQPEQGDGDDAQPEPSDGARQSQLQKLEQRGKTAQQERNTGRQRDEYLDSDGAGTDRPW